MEKKELRKKSVHFKRVLVSYPVVKKKKKTGGNDSGLSGVEHEKSVEERTRSKSIIKRL